MHDAFPAVEPSVLALAGAYNQPVPDAVAPSKADEKSLSVTVVPDGEDKATLDALLSGAGTASRDFGASLRTTLLMCAPFDCAVVASLKPLFTELDRRAAYKFL